MSKYYIFYHRADFDGFLSGYLIKKYFDRILSGKEEKNPILKYGIPLVPKNVEEIIYIPYNWNDTIDYRFREFSPEDYVVFADCVAYQRKDQPNIIDICGKLNENHLIIFDHHKSTKIFMEQNLQKFPKPFKLFDKPGMSSACRIVYKNLYNDTGMPTFIQMISDHDIWYQDNGEWEDRTVPFQYGMRYIADFDFKKIETAENLFGKLFQLEVLKSNPGEINSNISKIISFGKAAVEVIRKRNVDVFRANGFRGHFKLPDKGIYLNAVFVSDYMNNSKLFEDACDFGLCREEDPDIDIWVLLRYDFRYSGYDITVFSKKDGIDAAEICGYLGGGGHAKVAGAQPGILEVRKVAKLSPSEEQTYDVTVQKGNRLSFQNN